MNDTLSQQQFYHGTFAGWLRRGSNLTVNHARRIKRTVCSWHIYAQHHDEGSFGKVVLTATLPKDVKLAHGQDNYGSDAHGFVGDDSRDAQVDGDIILNQARTPLKWSIHRINEG